MTDNNEVLISVNNVSKRFCRYLKKSLIYGMFDIGKELVGSTMANQELRKGEFWALKNVSLEVRRGEVLGLIGPNGAGKSTLLKMLNGLIKPDEGNVTIRGRLQALVELGAGFNPVLTGMENIYINGAVLGIPKAQVDKAIPAIIEFAELGDFINSPVRSYSSGMKARLGFAVTAQLDPDILLIDEVLAVGDMSFQEKCMRRVNELRHSNKAIIFVTHSLYQIEALCNKAIWLEKGQTVQYGDAGTVVRAYLDNEEKRSMAQAKAEGTTYAGYATEATRAYFDSHNAPKPESTPSPVVTKSEPVIIRKVELLNEQGESVEELPFYSSATFRIHYFTNRTITQPLFNIRVMTGEQDLFEASMLVSGNPPESIQGEGSIDCHFPLFPLTPNIYDLMVYIRSSEGIKELAEVRNYLKFRITDEGIERVPTDGPMALMHLRRGPGVYVPHEWRFGGEFTIQEVTG